MAGLFLTSILLLAGFVQLAGIVIKLFHSLSEDEPELRASARMLTQRFRIIFLLRLGVLLMTLLLIPLILVNLALGESLEIAPLAVGLTLLAILATGSEMVGRYLFFVTVVPKKRPAGYF